ncbi:MAG: LysR family transcriptional regulator [Nannocystaceae bacterium]|nr:LysR family transcriptional regulator [Nannocystaceae bacterium]
MELRHLRYLLAVAEEGSFGAAARRLHLSQPPLSRQIRDLESEVGVQLLERGRHGARLTAAGATFVERTKRLFLDLELAKVEARAVAEGKQGRVRLGYSQAGAHVMARAIGALRDDGCAAIVEPEEMTAREQVEALLAQRIDMAVGYRLPPLCRDDVRSCRLLKAPLRVVFPRRLRRKVMRRPSCLNELPLFFLPQAVAPTLHAEVLTALGQLDIRPSEIREVRAVRTGLLLISAGEGFGVIPDSISVRGIEGIDVLQKTPLPIGLETWAFWRSLGPAAGRLLDQLRSCGRELYASS